MTLPTDYANETVSIDTHPDAHNETNAAVNTLDERVSTLEATHVGRSVGRSRRTDRPRN